MIYINNYTHQGSRMINEEWDEIGMYNILKGKKSYFINTVENKMLRYKII